MITWRKGKVKGLRGKALMEKFLKRGCDLVEKGKWLTQSPQTCSCIVVNNLIMRKIRL